MHNSRSLLKQLPLFLVLFIDSMGLGLLFPILNSIIVDPASTFLPAVMSVAMRDFLYGLTVGVFMLSWFFGSAILGDLSDTIGRKKALIICLLGSFFGYLLSAVAIWFHSLSLLVLGRLIAGFTAGSQPIAQASIVDVSSEEHKARNIGLILLSVSLGFVFGPIIGGVLSDQHLVAWFSFSTPMYFAALISLLNALLLWFTYEETFHVAGKIRIRLHRAIAIFVSAFQHPRIRYLSLVLLIMIFGWSDFFTFISMFVLERYHFTPLDVSLFMGAEGVGFAIGCGYLVDFCTKRFSFKWIVVAGILLTALGVLLIQLIHNESAVWIWIIEVGMAIALAYSVLLTIFSNQVSKNEQGWVMGVTGSIMALCFGVNALLMGLVAQFGVALPMYLSAGGLLLSAGLMVLFKERMPLPKTRDEGV